MESDILWKLESILGTPLIIEPMKYPNRLVKQATVSSLMV